MISLSADKPKVIAEAARVLKPGGRPTSSPPAWLSDHAPMAALEAAARAGEALREHAIHAQRRAMTR